MVHIAILAGVGIACIGVAIFAHNKKNIKEISPEAAKARKPLQLVVEKLNSDYPDGVTHDSIAERGKIIGHYLDNAIHDYITLTNGWKFEWLDVARYTTNGELIYPTKQKSMFILIDDLIYKMVHNEQSDLPQAV